MIGEACHFFDFFAFLTGSEPLSVYALPCGSSNQEDAQVVVNYADGSVCHLVYSIANSRPFGKERVEVAVEGGAAILEDFRVLKISDERGRLQVFKSRRADKGHRAELKEFLHCLIAGESMPISEDSVVQTTLVSFAALSAIREGRVIPLTELTQELSDIVTFLASGATQK